MSKHKILVVDDDEAVLDYLRAKLGQAYDVVTTHLPATVRSLARKERPHLIVCDVDMPDMDGGEVAAALADDPQTRDIPFLFLTAMVSSEEADDLGGEVGGRPGISKDAPAPELLARVKAMLG